jgi:hypothetical protein
MISRGDRVLNRDSLVPMDWPCGPLAIERGVRGGELTSREREGLERWSQPESLELLDDTPVSALVLPWADGSSTDEPHQVALGPLLHAARGRGLTPLGWVAEAADLGAAAAAAHQAGLAALATESVDAEPGFPVLRFRGRSLDGLPRGGFLGVTGNPWPGMKTSAEGAYDAWTGPTGPPWIDSNAWFVRLARDLVEPETTWLLADPEEEPPVEAYEQAVADAAVFGGRWVVALDRRLREGLLGSQPEAREVWVHIGRSLTFFETHRDWTTYRPLGPLGVISDFAGPDEFLYFEVVNLLSRRNILYRIVERGRGGEADLHGLATVLLLDETPPARDLVEKLFVFAERGGTLIAPPGWEARGVSAATSYPGYRFLRHGSGRVIIAREPFADPYAVVEDVFGLTPHAHDPVRVYNPGVSQLHYLASDDGGAAVLHMLRYSRRAFETDTSIWFRRPWASARMWELAAGPAERAEREAKEEGVEFHVPAVPVYCALAVSAEGGDG